MRKLLLGALAPAALAMGLSGPAAAKDLLFLSEDVPASLNYDGPNASAPPTQAGIVNLTDPLVYYKTKEIRDDGAVILDVTQFEGRLAESWTFDESTLTWTFKLRQGVKGCGGVTFDADDVVYTFARAKSVSGNAPIGWFLSNVASFKGFTGAVFGTKPENIEAKKLKDDEVRKVDQYTVQISQSAPNKLFLPVLTIFGLHIFDKETMEKHATESDPWSHAWLNNEGIAGFGPYCLDRWEKDKELVAVANPDYYRGKPDIDRVVMRKIPQSGQRLIILRSGQAQLVEHLTPKEYDSLRSARGVKVVSVAGNASTYLHMNFVAKPLDNVKLREAIAYAIPYDKIIRDVFFGEATKYNGVMPSFYPGFHQVDYERNQNLEKAKALLAEAGYPEGKGLEAFPQTFQLTYSTEKENILGPAATILQTELRKVGIPVTLNPIPQSTFSDRELVKKDLPFALIDHSKPIGVEGGYAIQLLYMSPEKGGISNYANYRNPEVDRLWLEEAKEEPDDAKRSAVMAEIQEILMKDVVIAPIVENKLQWAMSENVSGVGWHPEHALRWYDLKMAE